MEKMAVFFRPGVLKEVKNPKTKKVDYYIAETDTKKMQIEAYRTQLGPERDAKYWTKKLTSGKFIGWVVVEMESNSHFQENTFFSEEVLPNGVIMQNTRNLHDLKQMAFEVNKQIVKDKIVSVEKNDDREF